MERAKGFEPSAENLEVAVNQHSSETAKAGCTQIRAQIPASATPDLAKVVAAWAKLSLPLKAAILAIVGSATGKEGH
jgi:hypothetical protein